MVNVDKAIIQEHSPVRVTWVDSGLHIDHGWADKDAYMKDANAAMLNVQTVGILMYQDDEITMVGLSYDKANENWMGAQVMLNKNITEVEIL